MSDWTVTPASAVAAKALADWIMDGDASEKQIVSMLPAANAMLAALRAKDMPLLKITRRRAVPAKYEE